MAHWSEEATPLAINTVEVQSFAELSCLDTKAAKVYLLRLPQNRTIQDATASRQAYESLANFSETLNKESLLCILATPSDAYELLPYIERSLRFQLWVAIKTTAKDSPIVPNTLPNRHTALLVMTRYQRTLEHTKTRIQYSYCPSCGKTTKDYGGKKHTYHEYGTLVSDVWRDIEINPDGDISPVTDRLRDLFGLKPFTILQVADLRMCSELQQTQPNTVNETFTASIHAPVILESRLIRSDCLTALKTIPNDSIDFCFTDPPYNLKKKYDKWDDALESIEYFKWCDEWLTQLHRVLKPGCTVAVLNIPLWAARHCQYLATIMKFQSWIVWEALSFPVRMIMPSHYAIVCFSKGEPRSLPGLSVPPAPDEIAYSSALAEDYCVRASCISRRSQGSDKVGLSDLWWDIHRLKHNSRRVDHPCQLPPMLMRRLYALFTKPGEIILDCFDGAGTSTLVAHQMNRRYIGIELSEKYSQIAQDRHAQIGRREDPFGKINVVPQTKNNQVKRLQKQKYQISKKVLQLDIRRIAKEIGRLPTKADVEQLSPYPLEFFETYFVSWGEVCAAARTTGMSESPVSQQDSTLTLGL